MRRKDREMPREFALEVSDKCEYAVLSMVDVSGEPYCVPVTIVRIGNSVYFHCAYEGLKIECLKNHNRVCIACVGDTKRALDKFTTEFESAVIRGDAFEVTDEEEKISALRALCQRHTPTNMAAFDDAVQKSLSRTAVWRVDMTQVTGKRKKYHADGKEMKSGKTEG